MKVVPTWKKPEKRRHRAYPVVGLRNFIYDVSFLFILVQTHCSSVARVIYTSSLEALITLLFSREPTAFFISSDKLILSTQFHPIYLRAFLILSFHLCPNLPRCLFSSDFLTETLYVFFCPPYVLHLAACHSSWFVKLAASSLENDAKLPRNVGIRLFTDTASCDRRT